MLKYCRKIRQRLVTENKFSRYLIYAIEEIVIVVIGILIALSINNWNERQKLELLQKDLLSEVVSGLEDDLAQLDDCISDHKKSLNSQKII